MPEPGQDPHVLKQPNIGPQQEVTPEHAYLAAVTSLPRLLSDIGKVLVGISESLAGLNENIDTIALYYERKGAEEGIFSPEDFPTPEEESGGENEAEPPEPSAGQ